MQWIEGIKNKGIIKLLKSMKSGNMSLIYNLMILFSLTLSGCGNDRSKSKLSSRRSICGDSISVEIYVISGGGAHGGDRVSDYITDSINFRMYVGTYDNAHENITYECKGDSVYIEKISMQEEGAPYNTKVVTKVLERKGIDLNFLRKQKKFD